jgi:hypothetical protein
MCRLLVKGLNSRESIGPALMLDQAIFASQSWRQFSPSHSADVSCIRVAAGLTGFKVHVLKRLEQCPQLGTHSLLAVIVPRKEGKMIRWLLEIFELHLEIGRRVSSPTRLMVMVTLLLGWLQGGSAVTAGVVMALTLIYIDVTYGGQ